MRMPASAIDPVLFYARCVLRLDWSDRVPEARPRPRQRRTSGWRGSPAVSVPIGLRVAHHAIGRWPALRRLQHTPRRGSQGVSSSESCQLGCRILDHFVPLQQMRKLAGEKQRWKRESSPAAAKPETGNRAFKTTQEAPARGRFWPARLHQAGWAT